MGGRGMVCVTTGGGGGAVRTTRVVVTTRRTRLTGRFAAWRLRTTFFLQQFCTCAVAGTSAICIAPLPMIAPPQVQAQSLARAIRRSEEHTSELQSLMRISYAVFCLKNKHHLSYYSTINKHHR